MGRRRGLSQDYLPLLAQIERVARSTSPCSSCGEDGVAEGRGGYAPSAHDTVNAIFRSVAKVPQEEASHEFRRRVGRLRACQSDLRAHMKRIVARSDRKRTVAVHSREGRRTGRNACGPRVLSLFTGMGGLDLGLENAGFRTVHCVEQDPVVRTTLSRNRPNWTLAACERVEDAARELKPVALGMACGELDLIAAGPPCQPFSMAAQWTKNGRRGREDPRAGSLQALLRIVDAFRPRAVLLENVPGLIKGRTSMLPVLQHALEAVGNGRDSYHVHSTILNAADYGVPQARRRGFLLAVRGPKSFAWPDKTHADLPVRAWDAIGHLRPRTRPAATGCWADLLPSIPEGQNYLWHTSRGDGRNLFGYRTRYWSFLLKLAKNSPSWTLPATPGPGTGPFHWTSRRLAPSELLRLQSFPGNWRLAGGYRQQVQQIGNATPPLLAEVLGRALGRQLWAMTYSGTPALAIPRKPTVPSPEPTHPVPRGYLRLEMDHRAHPGPGRGPRPLSPRLASA